MRLLVVPGGSIGIPTNVTELPETLPWKTLWFVIVLQLPELPTAQMLNPVAAVPVMPKGSRNSLLLLPGVVTGPKIGPAAKSEQPVGLVQVCAAEVAPAGGSSIVRTASDNGLLLSKRLVTWVFKKIVMFA